MVFYLEIKPRRAAGKGEGNKIHFFANENAVLCSCLDLDARLCYWDILYQTNVSVNPRSMNTDTVEWHFETALGFDRGDKKSNAFNAAKCRLVGNNKDGENFSSANINTEHIYAQLVFVAYNTLAAAFDHSVASVTLAAAFAVITALETLLRVDFLSANISMELLGLLFLMHLTKKSCAYSHTFPWSISLFVIVCLCRHHLRTTNGTCSPGVCFSKYCQGLHP